MKQEQINLQNENLNSKRKRVKSIIAIFRKAYLNPKCHLNFKTPLELLVSTILSAQCTDERVNQVTKDLFRKYKTVKDYAGADQNEFENDIHSTGFYRNKAKAIINCCKTLIERYDGKVPASMELLTELDGVGRKTANVVLGNAFGIPGIVVDTHVKRLAKRIGLSSKPDPDKIEADLMELVSKEEWIYFSRALSDHGRKICLARRPLCPSCNINHLCPSAEF